MSSRIVTLPNVLTVLRMAMIPVFITLLYYHRFGWALGVFIAAGLTDSIDGIIARAFDQSSELGRILDPIADKLMLVTSFIVLSLKTMMPVPLPRHLPVPFWVTAAVISRDVMIIVGAATINMMTGFRGFRPSWLGKASTAAQIVTVAFIVICTRFPALSGYLPTFYTTVFALAVFSGVHYIFFVNKLSNEAKERGELQDAETKNPTVK